MSYTTDAKHYTGTTMYPKWFVYSEDGSRINYGEVLNGGITRSTSGYQERAML